MPNNYDGFLKIAQKSFEAGSDDEMELRNSVSRSYYYMYHAANELIKCKVPKKNSNGESFTGGVHKRLSAYLSDNAANDNGLDPEKTCQVGMRLKQMHALRVTADYYLKSPVTRTTAEMALLAANEIANLIEELSGKKIS